MLKKLVNKIRNMRLERRINFMYKDLVNKIRSMDKSGKCFIFFLTYREEKDAATCDECLDEFLENLSAEYEQAGKTLFYIAATVEYGHCVIAPRCEMSISRSIWRYGMLDLKIRDCNCKYLEQLTNAGERGQTEIRLGI